MCKCTPGVRTPYCGKQGCEWPIERKSFKEFKYFSGITWQFLKTVPPQNEEEAKIRESLEELIVKLDLIYKDNYPTMSMD